MDEEQIKALVQKAIAEAIGTALGDDSPLVKRVNGLASKLERGLASANQKIEELGKVEPKEPGVTDETWQAKLDEMQAGFDKRLREKDIREAIVASKESKGLLDTSFFVDTFLSYAGNGWEQSGGRWCREKDGTLEFLDDSIATFKGTERGKLFAPAKLPNGGDNKQPKSNRPQPSADMKDGKLTKEARTSKWADFAETV